MAQLLTGWRPAAGPPMALQQPSPPPPAQPWLPPCWAALEALPVAELRRIARTLNLPRTLTRTGPVVISCLPSPVPPWPSDDRLPSPRSLRP